MLMNDRPLGRRLVGPVAAVTSSSRRQGWGGGRQTWPPGLLIVLPSQNVLPGSSI